MCSIYGWVGYEAQGRDSTGAEFFHRLQANAGDRGRDGGHAKFYPLNGGTAFALIGNWRATPTTEVQDAPLQPYDGVVHNGTIANDKELAAGRPYVVDSQVLPMVLNRTSLPAFAKSLEIVRGSYALACVAEHGVYLATNYKPLYVYFWPEFGWYFSSMARHFKGCKRDGQAPQEIPPYTAAYIGPGGLLHQQALPRYTRHRAIVICSAGLDSTTVAYKLKNDGYEVCLVHFTYGCQAERAEIRRIGQIATHLGADIRVIDIPGGVLGYKSPLLQPHGKIAEGVEGSEYAHEWVPARNLVMLSLAAAYAEANDYHVIALGNNLEEAGAFPDNEEQMTVLFDRVLDNAVQNGYELRVVSPVGHLMKHEIVKLGRDLAVPYELTWSCYRGGSFHCGRCGPCFMRRTAFARNNMKDPAP